MGLRDWYDLEEEYESWPPPEHAKATAELELLLRQRSLVNGELRSLERRLQGLDHLISRLGRGSPRLAECRHKKTLLVNKRKLVEFRRELINRRIRELEVILSTPVPRSS